MLALQTHVSRACCRVWGGGWGWPLPFCCRAAEALGDLEYKLNDNLPPEGQIAKPQIEPCTGERERQRARESRSAPCRRFALSQGSFSKKHAQSHFDARVEFWLRKIGLQLSCFLPLELVSEGNDPNPTRLAAMMDRRIGLGIQSGTICEVRTPSSKTPPVYGNIGQRQAWLGTSSRRPAST